MHNVHQDHGEDFLGNLTWHWRARRWRWNGHGHCRYLKGFVPGASTHPQRGDGPVLAEEGQPPALSERIRRLRAWEIALGWVYSRPSHYYSPVIFSSLLCTVIPKYLTGMPASRNTRSRSVLPATFALEVAARPRNPIIAAAQTARRTFRCALARLALLTHLPRVTLAQRLNELAASNSDGLLGYVQRLVYGMQSLSSIVADRDEDYRLLRQNLFERFGAGSQLPTEFPVVKLSPPESCK